MSMTNSQIFTACQAYSPNFKNLTSQLSASIFDTAGQQAIDEIGQTNISEWFKTTLMIVLQKVDIADARNPLEDSGIVQSYDTPYGAYAQRIAVEPMKATNPKFANIADGDSVDMQVVRQPSLSQRFFTLNFAFQNYYTLRDYIIKQIFAGPYGMDSVISGIIAQMENSYKKQKYANTLDVLSAGINSTEHPLQSTQIVTMDSWSDQPTASELQNLILAMKNVKSQLDYSPSTSAFNAAGFDTAVDSSSMVALMRAGIQNDIQAQLTTGTLYGFDKSFLDIPFTIQETLNFGGLVPYQEEELTTQLYPAYNATTGAQIGWNTEAGQNVATVENGAEHYKDTNADVLAVVIQKGAIFESVQNPVQVIPAPYNAAGLYQTFWFSQPNNGINFDYYYNMIVFKKPAA